MTEALHRRGFESRAAPDPRVGVKRPPWGRVGRCPGLHPGRDIRSVSGIRRPTERWWVRRTHLLAEETFGIHFQSNLRGDREPPLKKCIWGITFALAVRTGDGLADHAFIESGSKSADRHLHQHALRRGVRATCEKGVAW